MARRRKTSLFDDLFTLATLLPWWASLLIAPVSWYLLHGYATSPIPPVDPHRPDMTGAIFRGLAMGLQYIVPVIFALGVIGSVAGRAKRKKLFKDVAEATQSPKTLDDISWREFELLVREAFRRKGFSFTERGGHGGGLWRLFGAASGHGQVPGPMQVMEGPQGWSNSGPRSLRCHGC